MPAPAPLSTSLGAAVARPPTADVACEVTIRVTVNAYPELLRAIIHPTAAISSVSLFLVRQLGLAHLANPLPTGLSAGIQRVTHKVKLLLSTETGIMGFHNFLVNPLSTSISPALVLGEDFQRAFHMHVSEDGTRVGHLVMHRFGSPAYGALSLNEEAARRRRAIFEWVRAYNQHLAEGAFPTANTAAPAARRHLIASEIHHRHLTVDEPGPANRKRHSHRRSAHHHSKKRFLCIFEKTSANGETERLVVMEE